MSLTRLILFILLLYSTAVKSSDLIVLREDGGRYKAINNYIDVYEDKTCRKTIKEISSPDFQGFRQNTAIYPEGINKNTASNYWIRYRIKSESYSLNRWVIMYYNEHIDSLECFTRDALGNYRSQLAGHDVRFSSRTHESIEPVFDLPVDTVEQYVYLRIKSSRSSGVSNKIMPLNVFLKRSKDRYTSESAFYGFVLFLLVSAILLYFGSKERIYLYYTFYVFALAVFLIEKGSLAFEYLWPEQPQFNDLLELLTTPVLIISIWLYTDSTIRFFKISPRGKWLNILMMTYMGYHLLFITLVNDNQHLWIPNYIIDLTLMFVFVIRLFKHLWKFKRESYLFMIGLAYIPLSYTLHFLRDLDVFNASIVASIFNYGFLVDAILFSYALSYRFKKLKAEKEHNLRMHINQLEENRIIRERVNTELERLVEEKTEEIRKQNKMLENANDQLSDQADLINKMNIQLDLKNRSLSKKVTRISKARVLKETTMVDDFRDSFPDDRACYLYMQEQKWGDDYSCCKCGHRDFVKGQKPFTRRCTNCHQQESVIYKTFLEGKRMKIHSAFMIIHLVIESEGKISAYDLEKMTGTSRKSCGKFKNQILEKLQLLTENDSKHTINNVLFV